MLIAYFFTTENEIVQLVRYKADNTDGSQGYTESTLLYALQPSSIFGSSFYEISYARTGKYAGDVGIINFILNIGFILTFVYKLIKLILLGNENTKWIGFGILYYIVQSVKLSMRTYSLSTLVFFMFLLHVALVISLKNQNDYFISKKKHF